MTLEWVLVFAGFGIGLWILFLSHKRSNPNGKGGLESHLDNFSRGQEKLEKVLKDEISRNREETSANERASREEINRQLSVATQITEQKLEKIRETLEKQLRFLEEDNSHKLDQMRTIVDEKLQATLEKRLSDSFRQVSERLERVHQGLGEMQSLASSVGDLKAVLNNVKTRGI